MRARIAAALAVMLFVGVLSSCSSGTSGYEIKADFARAVALYDGSVVRVMGIRVGEVTDVAISGDSIMVTMQIDENVPLRADVTASIEPMSLIGARSVLLGPAWKPGAEKLAPDSTIPIERTTVPVEPDDALESITDLLNALDPDSVAQLLESSSKALDGNGKTINSTLRELAELLPYLAEQDDELLAIAEDVNVLADIARDRETEIGDLLDDFALVTRSLADERESIASFLGSFTSLAEQGEAVLSAYEVTLPENLGTLASVALTLQVNTESLKETVQAIDSFQNAVLDAYDPVQRSVRVRIFTSQTALEPLLAALDLLEGVGL